MNQLNEPVSCWLDPALTPCKPMSLHEIAIVPGFGFGLKPRMHDIVDQHLPRQALQSALNQGNVAHPKRRMPVEYLARGIDADDAMIQ
jgi:hypothetical protein